jgi:multicomponent Na+:H+ antiporter subunit B
MTPTLELLVLAFVVTTALATALLRDVLAAVVVFGAYSLGMAMLWVLLRAPDVGLTEAAVGAGVMTPLFLLAIVRTTRPASDRVLARIDPVALCVAGVLGVGLLLTVPALPAIGDPAAPATTHVSPYYLDNAYAETGMDNVVTAILVGYRGFDTLGEVTVVFAAAVAVLVVLRQEVLA